MRRLGRLRVHKAMRTNPRPLRRASGSAASVSPVGDAARRSAVETALRDLEAWRARTVPDAAAPLDADDLVRLLRDCIAAVDLDPAIVAGFTVNTVHYYRRKDIIDPPDGRTASARYGLRHLWQVAGARLAGYLGLVTLAEARAQMRAADTAALLEFLAARVADARARLMMRSATRMPSQVPTSAARPLPGAHSPPAPSPPTLSEPALMIALPGNAWCIVPVAHDANHSARAAADLARALDVALRDIRSS